VAGQYGNLATVITATSTGGVSASNDPAFHTAAFAGINVEKATNAVNPLSPTALEDADAVTGPLLAIGSSVTWTYLVTNTGNVPLTVGSLRDDAGTPGNSADDFTPLFVSGDANNNSLLDVGEVWLYSSQGVRSYAATPGQYANSVSATATSTILGQTVSDQEVSHHFGIVPGLVHALAASGCLTAKRE